MVAVSSLLLGVPKGACNSIIPLSRKEGVSWGFETVGWEAGKASDVELMASRFRRVASGMLARPRLHYRGLND